MKILTPRLLSAIILLLNIVSAQPPDIKSSKGKAIVMSHPRILSQDSLPTLEKTVSRNSAYQSTSASKRKESFGPGQYIPRQYLSAKERRKVDSNFVEFLKDNKIHYESLQQPELHAADAFAIREKAPANRLKNAYPRQLRRHYKDYHHADKTFLKRFSATFNALKKHDSYLDHQDMWEIIHSKRGPYRQLDNRKKSQLLQSSNDPSTSTSKGSKWAKRKRTSLEMVNEEDFQSVEEKDEASSGAKRVKGLDWDLNLDDRDNVERHGHGAWSSPTNTEQIEGI